MYRITLCIALFGIVLFIALSSTIYVVRYDQRGSDVAMSNPSPHEAGAPRVVASDPPASFDTRWHLGG
jgi:hypothetical protein